MMNFIRFYFAVHSFVLIFTSYYVTSGLGIWGGKFRIGTRSEYVVADIAQK